MLVNGILEHVVEANNNIFKLTLQNLYLYRNSTWNEKQRLEVCIGLL